MQRIRILIIESHNIVREGVISLLNESGKYEVIAEAVNGNEAYYLLQNRCSDIDVVLLEIDLPGINGIELTKKIKSRFQDIKIVALTALDNSRCIRDMFEAGVNAYLVKEGSKEELFKALDFVAKGESFWCEKVAQVILNHISKKEIKRKNNNSELSRRELEVLTLILNDLNNHQIADKLNISPRTVEVHKRNLLEKTDTKTLAGLTLYAVDAGLMKR